jgi:Cft2 family RNA processing exonuclease
VFALGRAQELLLLLEEAWRDMYASRSTTGAAKAVKLTAPPVYFASRVATKALRYCSS